MNRKPQKIQQDRSASELGSKSCVIDSRKNGAGERTVVGPVRFGVFEFDPAVPELRRNGRHVSLQDMPLRVLEMLLEHPNELVARETFFARLWPHDESGILDDNLNTAVRKLRLALNDSAHHPRFLETVPKRGYRFVAPVETMREAPLPPPESQLPTPDPPRVAHRLGLKVIAPIVLLLIAVLIGIYFEKDKPSEAADRAQAGPTTLAVLPFSNASNAVDDDYFSDGLTEEIVDRLSRSGRLRVVSRTSTFAIKDKELGAQEIGRMLGADSLVEGSVRRSGDHLRINVRLINARDGYQLWSESYDRQMDDVLQLQEEIARSIANTLTGHVLGHADTEHLEGSITDPIAYDLYLKGRFYWHRRTQEGLRSAVEHFEQAVQRAPEYARAWGGLADAYAVLGFYDFLAPAEAFPKAREAARRALALDANNASAEATLGYVALYYDWDLVDAEARFLKSIALDPSYSKSHQWYGNLLTAAGRFEEAEREMRRAQQLEPLSLIASAALGWVMYHANRHEEALDQFRLTLALDPDFELAYLWSGWALESLGRYDEARAMLQEAVTRSNGNGISITSLARVQALSGEREESQRTLEQIVSSAGYVPSYEISKAWFALGDTKKAHEWLQRAYEQRSHSLVFLRVDPQLADYQQDTTFLRTAQRVSALAQK
jgi:TolB-like protein/DNA-binding winged helix-turn-helix (wHTH) protein/Tfp pilus assembly protein PilF